MEGKIFGVPLILILLVVFIALLIDVPMVLLSRQENTQLRDITNTVGHHTVLLDRLMVTPSATPVPTVSVTPVPSKAVLKTSVTKPATTSGQVR